MAEEAAAKAAAKPQLKSASAGGGKKSSKDYKNLTGRQKAAIFLVSVGSDVSSEIMKHLREDEVETLTFEIARLETIDAEIKDQVLEEFQDLMNAQNFITTGGIDYARELLEKSVGSQKAIDIINRLTSSLQVRPFDFIRRTDPAHLLNFIQQEYPQTIALILAYLGKRRRRLSCRICPRKCSPKCPSVWRRWTHFARRFARSGARLGKRAFHAFFRRLHGGGRRRKHRRNLEPCRPFFRKGHHRGFGRGRSGFGGRNQKENVRFRRHRYARRPFDSARASRSGHAGIGESPQERGRGSAGQDFPQYVKARREHAQRRHGIHDLFDSKTWKNPKEKVVSTIRRLEEKGDIVIARSGEDELVS